MVHLGNGNAGLKSDPRRVQWWNRWLARAFVTQQKPSPTGSVTMADDNDPPVERTTIVETGNGGGGGGVLAVVLLIIVVLVLLFVFRDQLGLGGSKTDINIPDKIQVNVN
jgi:hypothetical protein